MGESQYVTIEPAAEDTSAPDGEPEPDAEPEEEE